ncbi:MAG: CmcJ/NvfI family oxidoreductase, partial [Acidimicrobiales bacterium]
DATVSTVLGEYSGLLTLGEMPGDSKADYKKRRARVVAEHEVTIRDARDEDGGLRSWDFDRNGFTAASAPEPVSDFGDRRLLANDFVPPALEIVRQALGASRSFSVGFQIRTEATGRGTSQASYARFAHSDYGPEYESQFRTVLTHRFGVPEQEARTCGLCCVGFWAPIERPAYQDPLCLLDAASTDPENLQTKSVRLIYSGLSLGSMNRDRPLEERIPVPGGDAPSLAPIYSPEHRWIFIPDMTPDQALIFKQYDFRPGVASRACFHNSFRDRFHEDWQACPGRRSVEVRMLVTF